MAQLQPDFSGSIANFLTEPEICGIIPTCPYPIDSMELPLPLSSLLSHDFKLLDSYNRDPDPDFPSYDSGKMALRKAIRSFVHEILIPFHLPEMALQYHLNLCKQPTLKSQLMIKYCHKGGTEDYTIRMQKSIVSTAYSNHSYTH